MLREAKLITFQEEKRSVVYAPRDGFVGGPCLTYQCSGKCHIGFTVMMWRWEKQTEKQFSRREVGKWERTVIS